MRLRAMWLEGHVVVGLDWITSNPFGKPKKMLMKLGFGGGGGGG